MKKIVVLLVLVVSVVFGDPKPTFLKLSTNMNCLINEVLKAGEEKAVSLPAAEQLLFKFQVIKGGKALYSPVDKATFKYAGLVNDKFVKYHDEKTGIDIVLARDIDTKYMTYRVGAKDKGGNLLMGYCAAYSIEK